jgi:hypothetical protein
MTTLADLAQVIRSKNAGPYEITFDVLFTDPDNYRRVRESGALGKDTVAALYGLSDADFTYAGWFEPALAFKFTIIRHGDQGGICERDTFGAQQHAPLLTIPISGEPR